MILHFIYYMYNKITIDQRTIFTYFRLLSMTKSMNVNEELTQVVSIIPFSHGPKEDIVDSR